jgi:hypothetical protein
MAVGENLLHVAITSFLRVAQPVTRPSISEKIT